MFFRVVACCVKALHVATHALNIIPHALYMAHHSLYIAPPGLYIAPLPLYIPRREDSEPHALYIPRQEDIAYGLTCLTKQNRWFGICFPIYSWNIPL